MFKSVFNLSLWAGLAGVLICHQVSAQSAKVLRDPTLPLTGVSRVVSTAKLQLHSVLISENRRIAIINGRQVKESDVIQGAKVVRILPGKVIVRQNGKNATLTLGQPIKKQRSG